MLKKKLGYNGELLIEYVQWMKDRIIKYRQREDYMPILHVDVYGTVGIAFHNDIDRIITYCKELEDAAHPF